MFSQNQQHIIHMLALECKRQRSGEESVANMVRAYTYLWAIEECGDYLSHSMIMRLASLVEPKKNSPFKYRKVPVVFANGKSGIHHDQVPRAMDNLLRMFDYDGMLIEDFYTEFQKIHPFEDGNGRTGFLLYNFLLGRLQDLTVPPEIDWNK